MTTITNVKHSKRTPVTTWYTGNRVTPERFIKYLTVKSIPGLGNNIGMEYGLVRFNSETRIVSRKVGSFGWSVINKLG